MKYRAVIKQTEGWWIGWLVDLPGVNAQEKTREKLIESLRIGAEDMLTSEIPFEADAEMVLVDVPDADVTARSGGVRGCHTGAKT